MISQPPRRFILVSDFHMGEGVIGTAALRTGAATSPWSPYRRTLRAIAARERSPAAAPAEYLHAAARSIEALLAGAGAAVPFYVFGHTHRAERVAIGPSATYLNTGTWSTMLPEDLRASRASSALTFVEVEAGNGEEPRADVLGWDREAGRPRLGLAARHVGVGA